MSKDRVLNLDDVILEQQKRWTEDDHVPVETLVTKHKLGDRPDQVLDLIYGEILLRESIGQTPLESEYHERFPNLSESISRQFQVHRALQLDPADPGLSTARGGRTFPATIRDVSKISQIQIPGFELLSLAGRGGSGVAYRAIDSKLKRVVAIKLLSSVDSLDEKRRDQLLREAESAASLVHPAIVKVHQIGETSGTPFLVMEFVDGGSLADRMKQGPLVAEEAVKIASTTSNAIAYAHGQGVVHRDIKPGNILLDQAGNPFVCDFGLAKRLDAEQSMHTTDVVGTPAYMPPEQARGEAADKRSDVYSLGATLYEMLSGRSPFQAATPWEILNQVLMTDPVPLRQLNPTIPKDLETICTKCLEKDPARRYESAQDIVDELGRFSAGQPIQARPVSAIHRIGKWCSRNKRVAALAATSLGLLLALGIGSTMVAFSLAAKNESIRTAEAKAVADRSAAVGSLQTLVDSLYEDLSKNEATIKTREKVVNAAIEGLKSITNVDGDQKTDRIAMLAHQRIGNLLSLRGSKDEASEEFETSITIARSLEEFAANSPDYSKEEKLDAKRELALAIDAFVGHRLRVDRNIDEGSVQLREEVRSIVDSLIEENPDDVLSLGLLTQTHARDLEAMWLTQAPADAIAKAQEALIDVERLLDLTDANKSANVTACDIHLRLGRAFLEMGDIDKAPQIYFHFSKARTYARQAIELSPDELALQDELATNDRMTGTFFAHLGLLDESLERFKSAQEIFEARAMADPDDTARQLEIASNLILTGDPLRFLGKFEEAAESYSAAVTILENLLEKSPGNNMYRTLAAQASQQKGDSLQRLNRWDETLESYRASINYLADSEHGPALKGPKLNSIAELSTANMHALRKLTGDPTPAEDFPRWGAELNEEVVKAFGLMLIIQNFSPTAKSIELSERAKNEASNLCPESAFETIDDLANYVTTSAMPPTIKMRISHAVLRSKALIARNLSKSSEPDDLDQSDRLAESVSKALGQIVAQNKNSVCSLIFNEPDFKWLRETESFKSLNLEPPGID